MANNFKWTYDYVVELQNAWITRYAGMEYEKAMKEFKKEKMSTVEKEHTGNRKSIVCKLIDDKCKLEDKLNVLIKDFEAKTMLSVVGISVKRSESLGSFEYTQFNVQI